ncbi:PucR family transcriptional regulator [Paenibacillus arenilitoris]|uniref:PucR family transcriptional regulator ligand-binding domain-containing protein n=1 Tax=Paenibacillus arenilitoris TaxID=2772299 RepID=A0A927CPU8_9BACL|nr:PucR family transcriptional regulator [Paenibacillus arenilitoris]MBD2871320.1 PucR family transcriptional regulator ligand-binding domain-containing protein [Paenibacillus arenilitoris]
MLLKELLALPIYANAKVVAGNAGTANSVQSVNIMDAPDIIHYLKPQELLLTTGYAMKDHPEALLALVANMAEVGCAGLAIKTKRFFREVPEDVLRHAEELRFPIIELSLEQSLGDLANYSLSHILEKRTEELRYALSAHKRFSQMILQGKSMQDVTEALARLIGSPVMLLDGRHAPLCRSASMTEQLSRSLLPRLQAEELGTRSPHVARTLQLVPLEAGGIVYQAAELQPVVTFQQAGCLIALTSSGINQQASLTKHAMEQAANVLGLEMLKEQAVKERSRRYKNEFFSDFVDGLITSEQELIHRGNNYGLLHYPVYISVVARRDAPFGRQIATGEPDLDWRYISERDRHYDLLKSEFAKLDLRFVLFTKNEYFCFLLALRAGQDVGYAKDSLFIEQLKGIVSVLGEAHGIPISIGVGKPVPQLSDIPLSYKEAVEALQTGYDARKKQFVQPYRAKNISSLLRMIPKEELREYYNETFKDLLRIEGKERSDLLKTLSTFYDTHCQLAETAKLLFVHRNTVTYRLDKCERLTGRDLRDPVESLRFRTAFQMESLIQTD